MENKHQKPNDYQGAIICGSTQEKGKTGGLLK
jgi:hypothetical protein